MTAVDLSPAAIDDGRPTGLLERARRVGEEAAGPNADAVDRDARFPKEAVDAMREQGLLGALVPRELGGWGAPMSEVGESIAAISRHCASSAMILAMHHLQVACLVRHGTTPALRSHLADVAQSQLLLASATSEVNIGGQLRKSSCAVERDGDMFRIEKQAPVVSYGAYADAILVTGRRDAEAAPGDQVLVVCLTPETSLTQTGAWDTLGLRGTCSSGFLLQGRGPTDHVLPVPFADIAARTMLPVSHILWGYVWLGLAGSAVARARSFVQSEARSKPGVTPLGSTSLAELMVLWRQLQCLVREHAHEYDAVWSGDEVEPGIGDTIAYNSLKVAAARQVVDVVGRALLVCGISGYREDSPYCLGRQLRDAHGAAVMVNNARIIGDNAQLLLVHKGEL
jgi:acyl-CoA dehydrogenase